jgi:voltage-gated potassium channel Kch
MLLVGILGQISLWTLLFLFLNEFEQYAVAFYHSTVNFGSLGYGDIVMSEQHRLLGALEAINGVLMIGISTAALSIPFKDILKTRVHIE